MAAAETLLLQRGRKSTVKSRWWPPGVAAVVLVVTLVLLFSPSLLSAFPPSGLEELREIFRNGGGRSPVIFVLVAAAAVALGVPRLLLATLGGALFGWWWGLCLSQVGTLLGCWLTFLGGRTARRVYHGRGASVPFLRVRAVFDLIGRRGVMANVLIRLMPVGNCFATNLLMSVTPIRHRTFLLGTFLGTLPLTASGALVGGAGGGGAKLQLWSGVLVLGVLGVVRERWRERTRPEVSPAGGRLEVSPGPSCLPRVRGASLRVS